MESIRLTGLAKRAPVVNGIFYPENREVLVRQLDSWGLKEGVFSLTGYEHSGGAKGGQAILAPHAAWELTGRLAGCAFAALQEDPALTIDRVLLLGTTHNSAEEGIYLSESAFFETPLGDLWVDQKINRELAFCSSHIKIYDIPHLLEHALEVLLPMVKYCYPSAKIVPVLMSGKKPALISCLAKALWIVLEKYAEKSLFVVSSNVSCNNDPALALAMAREFCSHIADMDARNFLACLEAGRISACGGALVASLLESGLMRGRHFSALCPLAQAAGENGNTFYYGAFNARRTEKN